MKRKKKADPWAAYKGLGSDLIAIIKRDIHETKCCGLICLPEVFTRLSIAWLINKAVDKRVLDEREACAKELENMIGADGRCAETCMRCRGLRQGAKYIRARGAI